MEVSIFNLFTIWVSLQTAIEKALVVEARACLRFAALIACAALEAGPYAASGCGQLLIQLTCVNGSFDQFQGGYQLCGACDLNCKLASGQFQGNPPLL